MKLRTCGKCLCLVFGNLSLLMVLVLPCRADIEIVREVVVAPKTVHAAANIGYLDSTTRVRMDHATVRISAGPPLGGPDRSEANNTFLPLAVTAAFEMVNTSDKTLALTVGFPISNATFSAYAFQAFHVMTDGEPREVFRRVTSYPRQLHHEYVSGAQGPERAEPPWDMDAGSLPVTAEQFLGEDPFNNLMVWAESFKPGQKRIIEVRYELDIPLQDKQVIRKKVTGNFKGIWPQEANNAPLEFVNSLPDGRYHFFDYYLTTGASWFGPIGTEDIILELDSAWNDHTLYASAGNLLQHKEANKTTRYAYHLRDAEPTENLYFALRPASPDSVR